MKLNQQKLLRGCGVISMGKY